MINDHQRTKALYGSTAMPKQVFGEGALLNTFYDVMKASAPAAWELNEAFLSMWNPEALINEWVLPDNFHVKVKVMDKVKEVVHFLNQPFDTFRNENVPMEQGRSLGANTVHSLDALIVREITRRCDYDPKKVERLRYFMDAYDPIPVSSDFTEDDNMVLTLWEHYQRTGYLSARILDHLTLDNLGHVDKAVLTGLLDSLPEKPFKVVSIHDCFRCLPHYGNDLRKQYNLQLHMIAKSSILSDIITQIIGANVNIGKLDPTLADDILEANYALS